MKTQGMNLGLQMLRTRCWFGHVWRGSEDTNTQKRRMKTERGKRNDMYGKWEVGNAVI